MSNSLHRIRRQRWLVSTSSTAEALAIRKYLLDCGQESVLPVFEKAFDEAVDGEQIIHIPRIELRLQVTSEKQLTELLHDLILQQIREQLQSLVRAKLQPNSQADSWHESTAQENRLDILLHYLRSGSMPWQAANGSIAETAIELTGICRRQWPQLLDYLHNKPETAIFYFRLFQLIPEENIVTLITALTDDIPQPWISAMVLLITALSVSGQRFFSRYTRLQ
jgi:hypothetical protein